MTTVPELFDVEVDRMLLETADELFARHAGADDLWERVEEIGLASVGVPEEAGGAGGSVAHLASVLRAAGRHAVQLPLASTAIARWALAEAGVDAPDGPLAVAVEQERVRVGDTWLDGPEIAAAVELRLALAAAAETAGLLETVRRLTIEHVTTREQFGGPIARLPVVRDRLAVLAEHVAAAGAAVDVARTALAAGHGEVAVAAAKVCTAEAAREASRLAHQLHGAIGVTTEHVLQRYTRRLWACRDDAGDERLWARRLGAALAGGQLWERIVAEAS